MARSVKIFSDLAQGRIFFFGTRIRPAPLGGIVAAVEHPSPVHAGKIRVTRSDLFQRDGVTARVIFKRLLPTRVKNQAGQFLVGDLGFSTAQVIDYINDQANKKSNEIDIQNNGALVGGGTTLNFTGSIDNITVTGDVATISLDQIGVTTSGGYVGTGVTLFDFRGSGVSTVTPITSGISTIFIEGGSGGTVNASDIVGLITTGQIQNLNASQLTGTVATGNLPITSLGGVNFVPGESDSTPAFDLSDATGFKYNRLVGIPTSHFTTLNEFEWYQQYANPGTGSSVTGPELTSINPGISSNPYYYGTQLKPNQEMVWTHSLADTGAYFIGVWGGTTTFTPANAGDVSLWNRSLAFRNTVSDGHHIDNAGTQFDSTGFDFVGGVSQFTAINNNTSLMRLRYNGTTNKLEIWKGTTPTAIATATAAQDGNPITISAALSTNATLPGITTVQYYVDQTNWKYHNTNEVLENNQHNKDKGVVYYKDLVRRGEELVFSIPSGPLHVGLWDGGTGITGISNVGDKSNWSTKFRFSSEDTRWQNANTDQGKTGIDLAEDVETDGGSYSIRFNYNSQKLELWEIDTAYDWKIATANVALGVTETYIYFSTGSGNIQNDPPESLPGSQTLRASDYVKVSSTNTSQGPTLHHGVANNDVWKSNKSLRPGMKIKFTVPEAASNQYWATGYEGTDSQSNAYSQGTSTWRLANTERIIAYHNTTRNDNYTAAHDSASTDTYGLALRNLSWRYNTDNSWDLFDEDTDEIILTGDSPLDGNDMYPYLLSVVNGTSQDIVHNTFQWEWNAGQWFTEYRDYESGGSATTFLTKIPNGKPLKTFSQALPTQSGGFYYLGNAVYKVTWGEKMRPGQELSWTQLSDNSNGTTKNNMIIGVLNSDYDAFTAGFRFFQGGYLKSQGDQDSGVTVSAGGTSVSTSGTSMRLQYEYGTNKLVCYSVNAGVRTKLGESTSALDGNPIFISMGGESTRIPTTQGVSIYGWETVHEGVGHYNPWGNWRIGGFPENVVGLTTGNHASTLTHRIDQVWRHKDGLAPGYKMHWVTPASAISARVGQWKTSNASSGLTNVESTTLYWDWGYRTNTSENYFEPNGMTLNTGNSNFSAVPTALWLDPNPGVTKISIRYHSDNTLDLFDESNGEVIMTKDASCDGNPIFISHGSGVNTTDVLSLQDDFFSGGDVGIALTTTSV